MAKGTKERFEEILSRSEYQIYYEDTRSIWQRIKDWFMELIAKALEKLFPALESTTNVAGIIVTIIVIIVVIALGFVLYRVYQNRSAKRQYEKSVPFTDLHEMNWTYRNHFDMAEQKEQEKQYEQAIRHLFLALLLYYHEVNWLEARIWKTNWEYYAELLKMNKQSARSFNEFTQLFDYVTYGNHTINVVQYEKYRNEIMDSFKKAQNLIKEDEKEE